MSRESKALSKLKRANAKRQPLREALTLEQFETLLTYVEGHSYKASRIRIALILLYYTGLRVSNLLVLKLFHIQELLHEKETHLPLIKGGSRRHFLSVGTQGKHFLDKYARDVIALQQGKTASEFFFTANPRIIKKPGPLKALDRSNFDVELNAVLKKASLHFGKHFRTHSFRATFVTDLLKAEVPIHKVREVIGHSDIKSTSTYQRSSVTQKEVRSIIAAVNKSRLVDFKVPLKPRKTEEVASLMEQTLTA